MTIDPREILITAAHNFYQKGWMAGTAGNLSLRVKSDNHSNNSSEDSFWITASGRPKGHLRLIDFVRVGLDGQVLETPHVGYRPSAETQIHQVIYQNFPEAQACYHIHSIEAKLASHFSTTDDLPLPPIEMLKGLGIWEKNPQVTMPLFANHLEVEEIAKEIGDRFRHDKPNIPALLIRDHGVTVWAKTAEEANNYIEITEYIFRYMVAAKQINFVRIENQ